jgi:membrane fusion protein, multidrug efflux system
LAVRTPTAVRTATMEAEVEIDKSESIAPTRKRHSTMTFPLLVILTILIAGGWFWWQYASVREETDDAYVNGHLSTISSRVSGTVNEVKIEENERVKEGQLLVVLDPKDYEVAIEQIQASLERDRHEASAARSRIDQSSLSALGRTTEASGDINAVQADIASSRAALLQAKDRVRQAESRVKEQQAQLEFARSDFERYKTVYENRAVTKQQYDKARQNMDVYVAQLQQAKDNLEESRKEELMASSHVDQSIGRLKKSQGGLTTARATERQSEIDSESYASALAATKKDEATLKQSRLQLSYTTIKAPIAGRIGKKSVEIGQRVEPGQSLMSLVQDEFWVTANFKETQVGRMRVGQRAEFSVDALGEHKFKASVESLSPASGAKFSMLPPDNATGNFTKVVQRIPVRIKLDKQSLGPYFERLAPGMSCIVTVFVAG